MFLTRNKTKIQTKKILVVDDERGFLHLLKQNFFKQIALQKYEFIYCEDVPEALKQIRQNLPDILLVDIQMQPMRGFELMQMLRRFNYNIPTIIISAYGDMKNISQAMNLRAYDFINKPIDFDKLEKTIDKVLEIRAEEESQSLSNSPFPEDRNEVKRPANYVVVCKQIQMLDDRQQMNIISGLLEKYFTYEQLQDLQAELPGLMQLAIQEEEEIEKQEEEFNLEDQKRQERGLIPLKILHNSDIEVKVKPYKKKTGEMSYYRFIFLRWQITDKTSNKRKSKKHSITVQDWADEDTRRIIYYKLKNKKRLSQKDREVAQEIIEKLEAKLREQNPHQSTFSAPEKLKNPPDPKKKKTYRLF